VPHTNPDDLSTFAPDRPPPTLADWFATPQGQYVLGWERARLDDMVADLFGYFAVQVGLPRIDFLRANRIPWRTTVALDGAPGVIADAQELPFATESLDLVLLPHLLECSSEPHQILREVERVLRPEGELIVSGFNPVSLWGLRRLLRPSPAPPWDAEFVSVARMKDWLKLLNFEMLGGHFGCYRPPFESEQGLSHLGLLETVGARSWPVAGAVYVIQAKKRVAGMRMITPARARARARLRLVAPAARAATGIPENTR
jgi:SAM-dependent methyltransferase